jgi:hypothetical protein
MMEFAAYKIEETTHAIQYHHPSFSIDISKMLKIFGKNWLILSKFLNVLCFEEMVAELKEKVETIK